MFIIIIGVIALPFLEIANYSTFDVIIFAALL